MDSKQYGDYAEKFKALANDLHHHVGIHTAIEGEKELTAMKGIE